jgi:hypothetical protein
MSGITFPKGPSLFAPLQPSSNAIGAAVCERLGIAPRLAPDEKLAGGHFVRVRGVPVESVPQTSQRARILPKEIDVETGMHSPPFATGTEADALQWLRDADNVMDLRGLDDQPHGPPHELVIHMQTSKNIPSSVVGTVHARVALFSFFQRREYLGGSDPARWAPMGVSKLLRENVPTVVDMRDSTWGALPTAFALVAFLPNYERASWGGVLEFYAACPVRLR